MWPHSDLNSWQVAVKSMRIEIADEVSKDRITQVRSPLPLCTTLAKTPCTTASQILLRDYQARKQLQHENLLPLLGFSYEFGPLPAMVSPWMNNGSLTTYLGKNFTELTSERKFQIVSYFSTKAPIFDPLEP
jgi:serine/threonine protein kinase